SLVLDQPDRPTRTDLNRSRTIRDRIRRIRNITVKGRCPCRRFKRQLPVGLKVEPAFGDIAFRRPFVVFDPLIVAGAKRHCFRPITRSFAFQIMSEERSENVLAVVRSCRAAKIDATELVSVTSRPTTVIPWTNHEKVLLSRVVTLK